MAAYQFLEKDIEEIIAKHHSFFIEPGLQLKSRQVSLKGGRFDLLFVDRFGDELLIEIKRGTVTRSSVAQLLDYFGNVSVEGTRTRLMLVAGIIAANWKMALDRQGIEYREYTQRDYEAFLEAHDPDLLLLIKNNGGGTPKPPPEPTIIGPRNLCDELKDFFALRNFSAGEGIIEKSAEQWLHERKQAKERYRSMFHPSNIEKMSEDDFKGFLYFKNNRCWTQLYRRSLRLTDSLEALRSAITHLQDESLPVEIRMKDVLHSGSYWINGLGPNIASGILHICDHRDIYGVWNSRTVDALEKLGYLNRRVYGRSSDYLVINEHLHRLRADLQKCRPDIVVDLGLVDSFVWFISKDKLDYVESKSKTGNIVNIDEKKLDKSTEEVLIQLILSFEKEIRLFIKARLGVNYEKILQLTAPELIKKWNERRLTDIKNSRKAESEIINYAEMGDYIMVLLRNRDAFNIEGYFLPDVVTHLKKISYYRGKTVHAGDSKLTIQQIYALKEAIEWIQNWMVVK